jgi:hypothetical protein
MQITVHKGEAVYVRSFSTRRAAIAQVVNPAPMPDSDCVEVQLVTDWYSWDGANAPSEAQPHAGDQVLYAAYRIEAIRP